MARSSPTILDARVTGRDGMPPQHPRVEPPSVQNLLPAGAAKLPGIAADTASLDALRLMAAHVVGALPVLEHGQLCGIFSERDHVRSAARFGQAALARPVREVMSAGRFFVTVADSLETCRRLMTEHRLRHLAVMEANQPVAVLALDEVLGALLAYDRRVFEAGELDQQLLFLQGTYSC